MAKLLSAIALSFIMVALAGCQGDSKSLLIGQWWLTESNVDAELFPERDEYYKDGTGLSESEYMRGIGGAWAQGFEWKIDRDGRLIVMSAEGVAQIYYITEISKSTLVLEGALPKLGNVRIAYSRHTPVKSSCLSWYAKNPHDSAFTINSADQLAGLAHIVNGTWGGAPRRHDFSGKTITLAKSIDLGGREWVPIGTIKYPGVKEGRIEIPFSGTFDGNGNVIKGVKISGGKSRQGLFGYIGNTGAVMNLGVVDIDITGADRVGGLAGSNAGAIENCYASGAVAGTEHTGGLAGINIGKIKNSHAGVDVSGREKVGGLAGSCDGGAVSGGYATGSVSGTKRNVGGLVGANESSVINNSYASGNVAGAADNIGGLVGVNSAGIVINSYASGDAKGKTEVGGLVGGNYDGSAVAYSYASGDAAGARNVGVLVGENRSGNVVKNSHGARTAEQMTAQSAYENWDFDGVWEISPDVNSGFPRLRSDVGATTGSFTDARDSLAYNAVKIGGAVWMAENLNYATDGSWCYKNADSNCVKYGRLYAWDDAKAACPTGWRLPSRADWSALVGATGGDYAGKLLKSASGWSGKGNGADDYGFEALPGGFRGSYEGSFGNIGSIGAWWSATETGAGGAYLQAMGYNDASVSAEDGDKKLGLSVRCVKD
ncbi:MAG: fibrobacter succinogenes major paralogous domain-containing protein [Chitinispirillales bacterium]|nr:fibrobacter succinogenes major paralogous domain-containing protein [Chitinispirillales bacterium]